VITTEIPPTGGASKGVHGHPSRKLAKIIIPAFLLAAALSLAGSPAAMAAGAFSSGNMTALSERLPCLEPPPCRGDKPGVCPYYYSDQPSKPSTNQGGKRGTAPDSSSHDGRGGADTGGTGGHSEHQQQ
jgi:hypothetical protein